MLKTLKRGTVVASTVVILALAFQPILWPTYPVIDSAPFCGGRDVLGGDMALYNWTRDVVLVKGEVDRCCLLHDYCELPSIHLIPGLFIGHCECDLELFRCLRAAEPDYLASVIKSVFSLNFCYRPVNENTPMDSLILQPKTFHWLLPILLTSE